MAIIQVPHTIRVWVFVDTETDEVVKVFEDLESIELDDQSAMLDEGYEPLDEWNYDAQRVAEEQDWPTWDN